MELADVTDSKSVGLITRAGSTPATGTNVRNRVRSILFLTFMLLYGSNHREFAARQILEGLHGRLFFAKNCGFVH